jgi:hypothetical protein
MLQVPLLEMKYKLKYKRTVLEVALGNDEA